MRALIAGLVLLFSVAASAGPAEDQGRDILWLIRSPGYIDTLAQAARLGRGVGGLAWYDATPCVVMTPAPPLPDVSVLQARAFLRLINHELRHCREKRNFHKEDD